RPSNEELWYLKKDLVNIKEDYEKIDVPVYILHGDKDQLVPVSNVEFMKKMFINSSSLSVTIFPNEDHFIPWTRYKEIKELLIHLPASKVVSHTGINQ
ncbi:MAG TPA: alpha/beta hydrolase, partial [Ignavibacteriaceae bacterium]